MACKGATEVRNFLGLVLLKESGESNEALPQIEDKYFCVHDTRDADFKKIQNRLAYICKFGSFNMLCMEKCITSFIAQNVEAKCIFTSKKLNICSLSNGPGIDIIGFLLAIFNSNLQLNSIPSLNLISECNSWRDTFETCLGTAGHSLNSKYAFYCQIPNFIHCDIYSTFSPEVQTCITETDVLLMHNVFASSKATTNVFTDTLKKIFTLLKPGSVVFYIGSKKKTKDISEENFVKNFVNCIFGPTKVAFEDPLCNQDTAASTGGKTMQFGQVFFIVWQKKLGPVENEVLVSKSARKRKKRKNKKLVVQSEIIGNEESLGNQMKEYETDASSEISFTSSSVQSETSDTSNTTLQINSSQYVPFMFQDPNSNNSVQDNRNISLYFQNLLQSSNKNVIHVKKNKTEHEDLLLEHTYQNGIIQSTPQNLQYEKHGQKEVGLPKDITEINMDEIINKLQSMSECDINCKNITEIKTNSAAEQYSLVTIKKNAEIACNKETQSNMEVPIFQENAEINFACSKEDLDMRGKGQNCAVPMPQEDMKIKLTCSNEPDVKKESQNCVISMFQEHTESELTDNNEKLDVKKENQNCEGNSGTKLACNKEEKSDLKKGSPKCAIPMLQKTTETKLVYNKGESDVKKENQNCEENIETKLAYNKEEESDMKKENKKCAVLVLQENAETKVEQENLDVKLVRDKGNGPNVNKKNQNYTVSVLQENTETKLICNKETEFMFIKKQNKSSNAKTQKNINDINERDEVFKNEIQRSTIQSTNAQKIPTKINLASVNNTKYAEMSSDVCGKPLHSLEIEENLSKAIQNFIQSSKNMPISGGSGEMILKIQKGDSKKSKTKKELLHKAVNTSINKLGNQIEEHMLQNKMPNFMDKERSNSQSFDTMFKNCESLVNALEGLITSMKEDESLQNERTLNERNCCCTLIEQKARFANSCCMFCCSCMTHAHCPCRNICSCTTVNCMSCYPKCYSEANNITTPSIVIPLKNENLLQIFHTLSLDNTN